MRAGIKEGAGHVLSGVMQCKGSSGTSCDWGSMHVLQVRQTAVSADGSIVISCCDDATIWRHDCVPKAATPAATGASSGQAPIPQDAARAAAA